MFKIKIICIGKFKEKEFSALERIYLKRLSPFAKVELIEIREVGYGESEDLEKVKFKEAELIAKHLDSRAVVILLEEKGASKNSRDFASFINRLGSLGQEIIFVLGGSLGVHSSLRGISNHQISLSPLTFTHNFARVLLEEQLYRTCTILSGKAYHK